MPAVVGFLLIEELRCGGDAIAAPSCHRCCTAQCPDSGPVREFAARAAGLCTQSIVINDRLYAPTRQRHRI